MNIPDNWVVIKVCSDTPHYRLVCGWKGGYVHGDSWRINSGIVSCTKQDKHFLFEGESGSLYSCHEDGYKMTSIMYWPIESFRTNNIPVEILDEDTDWEKMQWLL